MTIINLDANATTAPWPEVIDVVARTLRDVPGNPGSRHALGRAARRVLEDSREQLAAVLGAQPDEIIFTSGGTEANNLALTGLLSGRPRTVVTTPGDHPSTTAPLLTFRQRGGEVQTLGVDDQGRLQPDHLAAIDWSTVGLVNVLYAHNETGVLQDLDGLMRNSLAANVPVHADGVQAVGKVPIDFRALQLTSLSFAAHKFHGPRGVGGLVLRSGARLVPLQSGGHQEHGRRPGTEAVALIAGMACALTLWQQRQAERTTFVQQLRDRLQTGLESGCGPVVVHGRNAPRLPNTLNLAFPGCDGEALLVALDLAGVACSLGSTCASGSTEPAVILQAMGCPTDVYRSSVRFSVSAQNTPEEIDDAIGRITQVVTRLRNSTGMAR